MRPLAILLTVAAVALPATAEIKVRILPDGTKHIYNEPAEARARRGQLTLAPVPEQTLDQLIRRYAAAHDLAPRLVQAVIQVESGYNPAAVSNKGAMGLMQLMPETAEELAVSDAFDAAENVRGGTTYLRRMLDRFKGDLEMALAAYNAGPSAVERYRGVPPYAETEAYIGRVLALYHGDPALAHRPAAERPVRGRRPYIVRQGDRILVTTDPPR